eukprot:14204496-Alexandrium_andersonii.AAC.1
MLSGSLRGTANDDQKRLADIEDQVDTVHVNTDFKPQRHRAHGSARKLRKRRDVRPGTLCDTPRNACRKDFGEPRVRRGRPS